MSEINFTMSTDESGKAIGLGSSQSDSEWKPDQGDYHSQSFFNKSEWEGKPIFVTAARRLSEDELSERRTHHLSRMESGDTDIAWRDDRSRCRATVIGFTEEGIFWEAYHNTLLEGPLATRALSRPESAVCGVLAKEDGEYGAWYLSDDEEYMPALLEAHSWLTEEDDKGVPALVEYQGVGEKGAFKVLILRDYADQFDADGYYRAVFGQ